MQDSVNDSLQVQSMVEPFSLQLTAPMIYGTIQQQQQQNNNDDQYM
jgi:hypothetical protein